MSIRDNYDDYNNHNPSIKRFACKKNGRVTGGAPELRKTWGSRPALKAVKAFLIHSLFLQAPQPGQPPPPSCSTVLLKTKEALTIIQIAIPAMMAISRAVINNGQVDSTDLKRSAVSSLALCTLGLSKKLTPGTSRKYTKSLPKNCALDFEVSTGIITDAFES